MANVHNTWQSLATFVPFFRKNIDKWILNPFTVYRFCIE